MDVKSLLGTINDSKEALILSVEGSVALVDPCVLLSINVSTSFHGIAVFQKRNQAE